MVPRLNFGLWSGAAKAEPTTAPEAKPPLDNAELSPPPIHRAVSRVKNSGRRRAWEVFNIGASAVADAKSFTATRLSRRAPADPVTNRYTPAVEAASIRAAFSEDNAWAAIRSFATPQLVEDLYAYLHLASPETVDVLFVEAFRSSLITLATRSAEVRKTLDAFPADWFEAGAIAYIYPIHFDALAQMLPLYARMGVKALELLPHLRSGGGDGGYDIIDHSTVAEELGGNEAFRRFVLAAGELGIAVLTDNVVNHVSDRHRMFQRVLRGDEAAGDFFHRMDDTRKIGTELSEDGLPHLILQHGEGPDAKISKPWHVFDFASEDDLRKVTVNGKLLKFFHTFYPFQIDLNLGNPKAWRYLVDAMGWHSNSGVLAQRFDAIPHVSKEPGTTFEDTPQTLAFEAALAAYWRMVQPKGVILPEVGRPYPIAAKHFGAAREVHGVTRNTQGDVLFGFDLQAAYRASLLTGNPKFLNQMQAKLAALGENTRWALWVGGHHDELRFDLIAALLREDGYSDEQIQAHHDDMTQKGGVEFANRGFGIRHASMRGGDAHAIAADYLTVLAGTDSIPLIYGGDEIGAENNPDFMAKAAHERYESAKKSGVDEGLTANMDARDLQRERPTAEKIERAFAERYEPLLAIQALNRLRETIPALRGSARAVDIRGDGVLAVARSPRTRGSENVLFLRNLKATPITAKVSFEELAAKLSWKSADVSRARDLLATALGDVPKASVRVTQEGLEIRLGPHDTALLSA